MSNMSPATRFKIMEQFAKEEKLKYQKGNELYDLVFHATDEANIPLSALGPSDEINVLCHAMVSNYKHNKKYHSHDFFELTYLLKGHAIHHFIDEDVPILPQSIYLLNLNVQHNVSIENDETILFNILIPTSIVKSSFLPLLSENDLVNSFFIESLFYQKNNSRYISFSSTDALPVSEIIHSLIIEYYEKKPCYKASIQCYLSLLFTELLREYLNNSLQPQRNHSFAELIQYMNKNLGSVTLNKLAEQFHYNPNYLSRLFLKYTGKTYSLILGELKLQQACRYLHQEDISIDKIAELLGFYDSSHFHKFFKTSMGVSPKIYRDL